MKQVSEMPTSGQFVAVFDNSNKVVCMKMRVENGILIHESEEYGDLKISNFGLERIKVKCSNYFIAD